MKDRKNYKFSNGIKKIGPKLKWFLFTEIQDLKLTSDYINFLCPTDDKKAQEKSNPVEDLRKMVESSLVREFTPEVKKLKSFDLLVEAVMHNIQKKTQ